MIKIDDKFYIDADNYCYIVKKYTGLDKDGNKTYQSLSYVATLVQALEYIISYKQRMACSQGVCMLQDLLVLFKEINKEVSKMLKKVEALENETYTI